MFIVFIIISDAVNKTWSSFLLYDNDISPCSLFSLSAPWQTLARALPQRSSGWKGIQHIWTCKGTQDPGQRLSTPVQFFKLWSHWSKNDGSNLGSHWWKYCLRICAKPNIWNNNNVRNWTFIVLQGVIRAVDQGKGSHQQAQPLPEVRVFYLAYLQKHLFALWMGSGEAQIWRWSEWDLGTWGLGSHESGEDEA